MNHFIVGADPRRATAGSRAGIAITRTVCNLRIPESDRFMSLPIGRKLHEAIKFVGVVMACCHATKCFAGSFGRPICCYIDPHTAHFYQPAPLSDAYPIPFYTASSILLRQPAPHSPWTRMPRNAFTHGGRTSVLRLVNHETIPSSSNPSLPWKFKIRTI